MKRPPTKKGGPRKGAAPSHTREKGATQSPVVNDSLAALNDAVAVVLAAWDNRNSREVSR